MEEGTRGGIVKPHRQGEPSPEQIETFNAKRRAEGFPEISADIFKEVGLTIDEIPESVNPWQDPRYITQIALSDNATGQIFYFKIPRINSPNYHNPQIWASGLLDGLGGNALMTVWTLREELLRRRMFEETKDEDKQRRQLMSDYSHMLARVREVVKPMILRLKEAKAEFARQEDYLLSVRGLDAAFDMSIGSLEELANRAVSDPTVGETDLLYKSLLNTEWISDRPAIAYAVDIIMRKYAQPPLRVSDVRRRIATFENKFLRANVDSSGASVVREIFRFKENPGRVRTMDGLIEELLTGEWFVWPPEANSAKSSPTASGAEGNKSESNS